MSDLKKGDLVEMTTGLYSSIYSGDKLEFVRDDGDNSILNHKVTVSKRYFKKLEDAKLDYESSNRKKLHDYIKDSGHTSVALGEALGNKWYFSNITKPSRMKRGDISSEVLLHIFSVVDSCGWQIEAIENTKDYNDDLVDDSVHEVESKKSNWMTLNKIAFGICLIFIILLISILYFVVSK